MTSLTDIILRETQRYISTEIFRKAFRKYPWRKRSRRATEKQHRHEWLALALHRHGEPLPLPQHMIIGNLVYGRCTPKVDNGSNCRYSLQQSRCSA